METRKLGSLSVSLVGLGCNNFGMRLDEAGTKKVVAAALDAGITLFDTADIYGGQGKSEEFLGRALGSRRDEILVATKFGGPMGEGKGGAKPEYVIDACDASLRRLGTDRIDLYQLHFPDASTPIEDTVGALDQLVRDGKVREIGCSNFTGEQIDAAEQASVDRGQARFVSAQNQLNLLNQRGKDELIAACQRHNLGILPYFPLASGLLTGKYERDAPPPEGTRLAGLPEERRERVFNERNFDKLDALSKFAAENGHTLLELAFSWLASLPQMASVIAGATKPEQVASNINAANWQLSEDELAEVDRLVA